jgi:hypothetical protein
MIAGGPADVEESAVRPNGVKAHKPGVDQTSAATHLLFVAAKVVAVAVVVVVVVVVVAAENSPAT